MTATLPATAATISEIFSDRAARMPGAVALVAGAVRLTYEELDAWANRLAHRLITLGVGRDVPVAVALPRTAEAIVAWLAVGRAGGVYLPVDPHHPADRIRTVLEGAEPAVMITTAGLADGLGALRRRMRAWFSSVQVVSRRAGQDLETP